MICGVKDFGHKANQLSIKYRPHIKSTREQEMRKHPRINLAVGAIFIFFLSMPSYGAAKPDPITSYDSDNDNTIDLAEISKVANDQFTNLESDNDGTLDAKEIGRKFPKKAFQKADPDKDGTLTKDEFIALVEALFTSADDDNAGTLDNREFKTKKGQALLSVLQ